MKCPQEKLIQFFSLLLSSSLLTDCLGGPIGPLIIFCACRWLQPDRAVDPEASELVIPDEPVKTGLASSFTIHTKDQDGKLVYVEGMKVNVHLLEVFM